VRQGEQDAPDVAECNAQEPACAAPAAAKQAVDVEAFKRDIHVRQNYAAAAPAEIAATAAAA
jgi:hypothetical protein